VVFGVFSSFSLVIAMTGVGPSLMALGTSATKHALNEPMHVKPESDILPPPHVIQVPVESHAPPPPHQVKPAKTMVMAPHRPGTTSSLPVHDTSGVQMTTVKPATKPIPVESKKIAVKPKYAFYEMLKDEQGKTVHKPVSAESVKSIALPVGYYLKVASLRNEKEAESLKAKLMLGGYKALLKQVKVHSVLWTRVMIGPYTTIKEASAAQTALQADNLHAILLKSDQVS
jgi:cell division protein FtsN